MLYHCAYTWHQGTTLEQVAAHVVRMHDAGVLRPEALRGYYGLVGGGAGVVLLEVDDPTEVNAMLVPSMHLMSWDVRAVIPFDYHADLEEFRRMGGGQGDRGG